MTGYIPQSLSPAGGIGSPFTVGAGTMPMQPFGMGGLSTGTAMMPAPDATQMGWEAMSAMNAAGSPSMMAMPFSMIPGAVQGDNALSGSIMGTFKSMMERQFMMMLLQKMMELMFMVMGIAALKQANAAGADGAAGASSAAGSTGVAGDSSSGGGSSASSVGGSGSSDLSPGGGWAGTEEPIKELTKIAGLSVTSGKRDTQMTASGNVSDHYIGNKTAYAHDLGWGSSQPTAESDAAASRVVAALGGPADWGKKGGVFSTTIKGIRYQVLYRTNVGGNHFNHIHIGAKRV